VRRSYALAAVALQLHPASNSPSDAQQQQQQRVIESKCFLRDAQLAKKAAD